MARRLFFHASCEYNKRPIITSNKYPYRPSGCKDTNYKYNRGPATGSEYL